MAASSVQDKADRVAALMEDRLRIGGRGLREKLRRGGRRLPATVRREAEYLAETAFLARNPKLAPVLDDARTAAAYEACIRHLERIGRKGRIAGYLLDVAGSLAVQVFVTAALALAAVWWLGLV